MKQAETKKFSVPGFAAPELLEFGVQIDRGGPLNLWAWLAVPALIMGLFIGYFFAARPYLPLREFCQREAASHPAAHALCLSRASRPDAVKECESVEKEGNTFDYCMEMAGTNEAKSFAKVSLVLPCLALLVGALWVRGRVRVPPFIRALRDRPGDIVWVYVEEWRQERTRSLVSVGITLGLATGARVVFAVARTEDIDRLLAAIRALAPGATVGHTEARDAQFRRDPASLRA